MRTTRREFLKHSMGASALLAFSAAVPAFLNRTSQAATARATGRDSILVVLQLSGGNDGLNTVIPYEDDAYHRQRPTLHLAVNQVHKLGSGLGLHPDMPAFLRLYQEGHLSIIQGVGYPNSDRNHDTAMRHWHTANPEQEPEGRNQKAAEPGRSVATGSAQARQKQSRALELSQTGWLGRAIDQADDPASIPGAFIGPIQSPFSLQAQRAVVPATASLDSWQLSPTTEPATPPAWPDRLARLAQLPRTGPSPELLEFLQQTTLQACADSQRLQQVVQTRTRDYPQFPLARDLKTVAQLIRADLGIRIFFAELGGGGIGGFDTHAGQALNHGALLRELSESVVAFLDDLRQDKLLDSVLLLTFSEFGRTLSENGRRGTDHGAAAPMFLAGGKLKGGLVGSHPSLTDLESDAPKFHTDFRRVYATVLEKWLGLDSQAILGEKFPPLAGVLA